MLHHTLSIYPCCLIVIFPARNYINLKHTITIVIFNIFFQVLVNLLAKNQPEKHPYHYFLLKTDSGNSSSGLGTHTVLQFTMLLSCKVAHTSADKALIVSVTLLYSN